MGSATLDYLLLDEAAVMLGIPERKVWEMVRDGKLNCYYPLNSMNEILGENQFPVAEFGDVIELETPLPFPYSLWRLPEGSLRSEFKLFDRSGKAVGIAHSGSFAAERLLVRMEDLSGFLKPELAAERFEQAVVIRDKLLPRGRKPESQEKKNIVKMIECQIPGLSDSQIGKLFQVTEKEDFETTRSRGRRLRGKKK